MFKRRIFTALSPILVVVGIALFSAGPAAATPTLGLTTSPSLYPAFSSNVTDYVIRCTGGPVTVNVTVPIGTEVSVDGQPGHLTSFSTTVNVSTGQEFDVTEVGLADISLNTYYIRCLPTDFANFTSQVP